MAEVKWEHTQNPCLLAFVLAIGWTLRVSIFQSMSPSFRSVQYSYSNSNLLEKHYTSIGWSVGYWTPNTTTTSIRNICRWVFSPFFGLNTPTSVISSSRSKPRQGKGFPFLYYVPENINNNSKLLLHGTSTQIAVLLLAIGHHNYCTVVAKMNATTSNTTTTTVAAVVVAAASILSNATVAAAAATTTLYNDTDNNTD